MYQVGLKTFASRWGDSVSFKTGPLCIPSSISFYIPKRKFFLIPFSLPRHIKHLRSFLLKKYRKQVKICAGPNRAGRRSVFLLCAILISRVLLFLRFFRYFSLLIFDLDLSIVDEKRFFLLRGAFAVGAASRYVDDIVCKNSSGMWIVFYRWRAKGGRENDFKYLGFLLVSNRKLSRVRQEFCIQRSKLLRRFYRLPTREAPRKTIFVTQFERNKFHDFLRNSWNSARKILKTNELC